MKVSHALSTGSLTVGSSKLDLLVFFGADPGAAPPRRPLNLSLVLDRSGSMGGAPLRHAIQAAQALVQEMSADDRLSVVIYDDNVDTIVPPGPVADKRAITQKLGTVRAAGCTNLSGGWLKGCAHVEANKSEERVNRVLLLTDGQANVGTTDPKVLTATAKQKAEAGVVTTTLGFGSGFNEDLLIGMARASEGNYYFIQSPDDAAGVFKIELEGLSSVVAQNLRVTLTPSAGASVSGVLNNYRSEARGAATEISLGDVYGVEEKVLAVELSVTASAPGSTQVATLAYAYDVVEGGAIKEVRGEIPVTVNVVGDAEPAAAPDLGAVAKASQLRSAKAKDEAVALADKGDLARAARGLREMIEALKNGPLASTFEIAEEIEQLDHYASRLEKKGYDGNIRKELRDQSYQGAARSRGDLANRGASGSAASLAAVSSPGSGVVLKCEREGGKLRIRVTSDGYDANRNVQFPRAVREEGVSYVVDQVVPSADGSFYRVSGAIKRLVLPGQEKAASSPARAASSAAPRKAAPAKAPQTAADLDTVDAIGSGVLVQCVKEGSKLRARVVSDGYNPDWNIRFPRSIREEGILYVVDQVVEAAGGGSYVASGDIKKLIQ
ncbi:MAG: VWA domain-containing protein [Byssovorax sp.]